MSTGRANCLPYAIVELPIAVLVRRTFSDARGLHTTVVASLVAPLLASGDRTHPASSHLGAFCAGLPPLPGRQEAAPFGRKPQDAGFLFQVFNLALVACLELLQDRHQRHSRQRNPAAPQGQRHSHWPNENAPSESRNGMRSAPIPNAL